MQKYNFFQNNFASFKNVRTFAPDFEREIDHFDLLAQLV